MTSVLVVDDSQFMRTVIGSILADHGYEVYRAADGDAAIDAVRERDPDVVTMDVQMPGMDGIEAVSRIMEVAPTRVLMLSAYTDEGADETLEALSRGAIDFLAKPSGEVSADIAALEDHLVEKVRAVERADVSSLDASRAGPDARSVDRAANPTAAASSSAAVGDSGALARAGADGDVAAAGRLDRLERGAAAAEPDRPRAIADLDVRSADEHPTVVIGASTGGPRVLEEIMYDLPAALDARVLVVQHMPPEFTGRFAERLDAISEYDVREATDGDRVTAGEAAVAPGGYHMEVANAIGGGVRVRLADDERLHGVRPAIDVTMESAAERVDPPLVGVALTGMGEDGADGISAIKAAGGTTIAQDRASSPIFGIPKQAIATGDVDCVLPGDEIAAGVLDSLATDGDTDG